MCALMMAEVAYKTEMCMYVGNVENEAIIQTFLLY